MSANFQNRIADQTSRVARKIIVTILTGGAAFVITNLTAQPQIWALTVSVFIGGVTLVVQFLVDFDDRLEAVEIGNALHAERMEELLRKRFASINEATALFGLVERSPVRAEVVTELVRNSTRIGPDTPPLLSAFAQSELHRVSDLLKDMSKGGEVTYDGEDRDWLLGLTRNVSSSIDATSLTTVDGGGDGYDGGLWASDLGQHYLEAQRDALARGVRVRRVFVLDRPELASDPGLVRVCRLHHSVGIEIRVLSLARIPEIRKNSLFDFILFDDVVSYETTAGVWAGEVRPVIVNTRLVLRPARVAERIRRFQDLWESADEFHEDVTGGPPSLR